MTRPQPHSIDNGRHRICGARSKSTGRPCQQTRLYPNGRCRVHGGPTPSGVASPNFKTGLFSRHLPLGALGRIGQHLHDPDARKIAREVAVTKTVIDDIVARVFTARNEEARQAARAELRAQLTVLDTLLTGETRRFATVRNFLTGQQAMTIFGAIASAVHTKIREWERDGKCQDTDGLLNAIQHDIERITQVNPKAARIFEATSGSGAE
jgi:hypothetical protein